jgi:DNA-binding transcriptional regulator YiaG
MRLASAGTNNGANKLTPDAVRLIRAERLRGVSRPLLARRFGVNKYTIRDIDYGYTWGWLE